MAEVFVNFVRACLIAPFLGGTNQLSPQTQVVRLFRAHVRQARLGRNHFCRSLSGDPNWQFLSRALKLTQLLPSSGGNPLQILFEQGEP